MGAKADEDTECKTKVSQIDNLLIVKVAYLFLLAKILFVFCFVKAVKRWVILLARLSLYCFTVKTAIFYYLKAKAKSFTSKILKTSYSLVKYEIKPNLENAIFLYSRRAANISDLSAFEFHIS